MELVKIIMYSDAGSITNNFALLLFRMLLSIELFRVHGMKKIRGPGGEKEKVPNPFKLPEKLNSCMAVTADTVVPFLVMLGLGTRLVVIPVIAVTAAGYLVVHRDDSAEVRDVPYIYAISFLFLSVVGFGTYSLDQYLFTHIFMQ